MFGDALRRSLELEEQFTVLANTSEFEIALFEVGQRRPSVVVLDADIPLEAFLVRVKRIRAASARSGIIALSMHVDQLLITSAMSLNVNSVLPKRASTKELIHAIKTIHELREHVVLSIPRASLTDIRVKRGSLTHRELQVLGAAAEGLSNRQIASQFGITEGTVKTHMHSIFAKLDTRSRIETVNKAIATSLISPASATLRLI